MNPLDVCSAFRTAHAVRLNPFSHASAVKPSKSSAKIAFASWSIAAMCEVFMFVFSV